MFHNIKHSRKHKKYDVLLLIHELNHWLYQKIKEQIDTLLFGNRVVPVTQLLSQNVFSNPKGSSVCLSKRTSDGSIRNPRTELMIFNEKSFMSIDSFQCLTQVNQDDPFCQNFQVKPM